MIRHFFYLSVMFFYINGIGYVFHFIISRKLGPEGYGEFMVLYSFMLTVGFFSNTYPTIAIKNILENKEEKLGVLRFLRIVAFITGLLFFIVLSLLSPYLKDFLHVSSSFSIIIIALVSFLIFLENVEKGYLQVENRFGMYSFLNGLELTLRLLFAIIFVEIGFWINGALSSTVFSMFFSLILLMYINKNLFGEIKKLPFKRIIKSFFLVSPSGFFVYADDIFIKRVFDPITAGYFASASILGKAYIWFILTLFSIIFVKVSEKKEKAFKYVKYFFIFIIFTFGVIQILLSLVGEKVFLLLFGDKYSQAYEILPLYIFSILPLLINLVIYYVNISLEKAFVSVYLHLILYYCGFVFIKFASVIDYLTYIFIINAVFLIFNLFLFLKKFQDAHKQSIQQ
ncbi:lipopolysaccharide biosynthesis protein [Sulfurihydrogenibium azorense]|uniref:lipopolysaccharide biosynthesis protein n=1 Tax=Sulfurihydrogenibium azorense TaxID=309806 RepID=UPI0002DBAE17|nr:oligosaccharide flippase family protein [Sulfurihydrogenibium azorense]